MFAINAALGNLGKTVVGRRSAAKPAAKPTKSVKPATIQRKSAAAAHPVKAGHKPVAPAKRAPAKPKKAAADDKPKPTETIEQGVDKLLSEKALTAPAALHARLDAQARHNLRRAITTKR